MIFSALALAAALQLSPPADVPVGTLRLRPPRSRTVTGERRRPDLQRAMARRLATSKGAVWCGANGFERVAKVEPGAPQRLGDLPMADHTLTVLRLENGCPVSSTVPFQGRSMTAGRRTSTILNEDAGAI